METKQITKSYSLTETAKLIRVAIKAAFPQTKFSVKSKSYSGGCSITASWTDGPNGQQVREITKQFEGASFDGMIDLKSYNAPSEWKGELVEFHADFVFASRANSEAAYEEARAWVSAKTGLPLSGCAVTGGCVPFQFFIADDGRPEVAHDRHQGSWYSDIVNRYVQTRSYERNAAFPETPSYVTEEFINAKIESMLTEVA